MRRILPRAIVAASQVDWPARLTAWARRLVGGRATVQLFVAFDDAYSAVAVVGLAERLATRRADLVVEAVIARGIPGDPAADAKRDYALLDAGRLARREGRVLRRSDVLAAQDVAFLAAWTAGAPDPAARARFAVAAMRELWFSSDGPVDRDAFAALWRAEVGGDPPPDDQQAVAASQRRMSRRKLYDTPVAVVAGQWFFAHERLAQIEHRLDQLGWTAAA